MGRLLGHLTARNRTRQSRPCRHATCPTLLARASRRACFPPALLACGISPLGLSLPGTAEAGLWPAAISRALAWLRFLPLLVLVATPAAQPRPSVGPSALPKMLWALCLRITISVRPAMQRHLQQLDSFRHQSARPGAAHQPGLRVSSGRSVHNSVHQHTQSARTPSSMLVELLSAQCGPRVHRRLADAQESGAKEGRSCASGRGGGRRGDGSACG